MTPEPGETAGLHGRSGADVAAAAGDEQEVEVRAGEDTPVTLRLD